jgi:hypothetical protein
MQRWMIRDERWGAQFNHFLSWEGEALAEPLMSMSFGSAGASLSRFVTTH